jgi:urea carboxylase
VDGKPWLLRFFDQIRFFPVSAEELVEWRRDFPLGRRQIRIEDETFRLSDYRKMLAENAKSIEAFQAARQAAFDAERADWETKGEFARVEALSSVADDDGDAVAITVPDGSDLVEAPLGGNVWKVLVEPGQRVEAGAVIAVIEAMKAEVDVNSLTAGVVTAVYAEPAQAIAAGAPIVAIAPDLEAAA